MWRFLQSRLDHLHRWAVRLYRPSSDFCWCRRAFACRPPQAWFWLGPSQESSPHFQFLQFPGAPGRRWMRFPGDAGSCGLKVSTFSLLETVTILSQAGRVWNLCRWRLQDGGSPGILRHTATGTPPPWWWNSPSSFLLSRQVHLCSTFLLAESLSFSHIPALYTGCLFHFCLYKREHTQTWNFFVLNKCRNV